MNNIILDEYWMYLRKSRADLEAEARGEGETLAKHRNILHKLAAEQKLSVTRIYQETVSGESIFHRPEMIRLLSDLETAPPKGVLVIDIERLGRGDKIDQGIIEQAFKESRALIITPSGTYDMNDESGEFNVEVRTFLARMEYKQIKKRLQAGRQESVENGNYIATYPPYGYEIHFDDIGRTLKPHPIQADVVRLIFELYTHSDPETRLGSRKIAAKLQDMKFPTYTGKPWDPSSVLAIIKNPIYIGIIEWRKKEQKKSKTLGKKRDTRTRDKKDWVVARGRHEHLISRKMFKSANEILGNKYHVPYQLTNGITNPLAGLIRCGKCGSSMVQRPYKDIDNQIMCIKSGCDTKSSKAIYIEQQLFFSLNSWLENYKEMNKYYVAPEENNNTSELLQSQIKELVKQLTLLKKQQGNLHDLLEQNIYDVDTFMSRNKELIERISDTNIALDKLRKEHELDHQRTEAKQKLIPAIESAIHSYQNTDNPAEKNLILKSVVEYCIYNKEKWQRNDQFELIVLPKLPQ